MNPSPNPHEWQTVIWQPVIDGRTHDVPIKVLNNPDIPTDTLLFAGLGEEERATGAGVERLGRLGLQVAGVVLPFHLLEPTRANIERTTVEAPLAIAQQLNEAGQRPAETPVNLIGKSQGGGVVFLTGRAAPEQYNALGALAPVGLNRAFLGKNSDHARRVFLRRLLVNNNLKKDQNPIVDWGNWMAGLEIGGRAISDIAARRLKPKIDFAMEHDFSEDVKSLKKDHPVRIFVGENDPMFKASELAYALGQVGCKDLIQVVPGSHSSLLTRTGSAQLESVGAWIISVQK